MFVVIANIQVRPECVEAFRAACIENSQGSLQEPGCFRFDVLQQHDDPTKFALFEIYRTPEDFAAHKETAHYAAWAERAAAMQAGQRSSAKYQRIHPENDPS
jgi:quinol monooxygenase YgiN